MQAFDDDDYVEFEEAETTTAETVTLEISSLEVTLCLSEIDTVITQLISVAQIKATYAATTLVTTTTTGPRVRSVFESLRAQLPMPSQEEATSITVTIGDQVPTSVQVSIIDVTTTILPFPIVSVTITVAPETSTSNDYDARHTDMDMLENVMITCLINQVTSDQPLLASDQSLLDYLKAHTRQ